MSKLEIILTGHELFFTSFKFMNTVLTYQTSIHSTRFINQLHLAQTYLYPIIDPF